MNELVGRCRALAGDRAARCSTDDQPAPNIASMHRLTIIEMTKKQTSKKRKWPSELKGPFPMQQLIDQAKEKFCDVTEPEQEEALIQNYVRRHWETETKRRVELLAQFFGEPWPQSEVDWLELIYLICNCCGAPGFQDQNKKSGRPKEWENRALFADVMSVVATMARPSRKGAVEYITRNPGRFLNRYSGVPWKTLHRQFLRAQKEFEEIDRTHPGPRLWIMSRDEMIKHLIDTYSAEAEAKRRGQVAQKSVKPKNA
jgi:hypothetical protein